MLFLFIYFLLLEDRDFLFSAVASASRTASGTTEGAGRGRCLRKPLARSPLDTLLGDSNLQEISGRHCSFPKAVSLY